MLSDVLFVDSFMVFGICWWVLFRISNGNQDK